MNTCKVLFYAFCPDIVITETTLLLSYRTCEELRDEILGPIINKAPNFKYYIDTEISIVLIR